MPTFTVYKGTPEGKIVSAETTRELSPDEVLVKITHSGLCGTDAHYKKAGIALGHEGAGTVLSLGANVTSLVAGDSVGWGYQHDCCGNCKQCLTGFETLCPQRKMYGSHATDQGSMGSHAVWKESFLFKIPEGMERKYAAPLMCGGATVYNALSQFGCRATDRVGVIGIGGLGHLAIQFAAKMGCSVVVFSSSADKEEEARRLGATEFIVAPHNSSSALQVGEPIDHLLVTTSQQPDWKQYLPIMAPNGKIFPLSVSNEDLKMPYMPLLAGQLQVIGSLVAARNVHKEMLAFAQRTGIKPVIMEYPMSVEGVTECMDALEDGKMRYRGVLVAQD